MPGVEDTNHAESIGRRVIRWFDEQRQEIANSRAGSTFDTLRPFWVRLTYAGWRVAEKVMDRFPVIEDTLIAVMELSERHFISPQVPPNRYAQSEMSAYPRPEMIATPEGLFHEETGFPTAIPPIEITYMPYCQSAVVLQRQARAFTCCRR